MYGGVGAVAGQNESGRQRSIKTQNTERNKPSGLTSKIVRFIRQRFNPQPEDELDPSLLALPPRYRPMSPRRLAKRTLFSQQEIKLMYRGFKQECPTGMVDEDTFKHIFGQFFPLGDASQYAHFVFNTIKQEDSGKVNFEEILHCASIGCRGSIAQQLAFLFSLYDVDKDGVISRDDVTHLTRAVFALMGHKVQPPLTDEDIHTRADYIYECMSNGANEGVSVDALTRWCGFNSRQRFNDLKAMDTLITGGDTLITEQAEPSTSSSIDFEDVSHEDLIKRVNEEMVWYRERRKNSNIQKHKKT